MFCGMGRLLGSILGGPLGALGRPPGASKLTRVFSHSMDGHDEEGETIAKSGCGPMAYTSAIIRLAKCDFCRWNGFRYRDSNLLTRSSFLTQGCDSAVPSPTLEFPLKGNIGVESNQVLSDVWKNLFILLGTSSLRSVLSKTSWDSGSSVSIQSTSPSDDSKFHDRIESEASEKSEDVVQNLKEDIRQIEMDLVNTQSLMIARVQGLQGIDLVTEGHFSEGFKLLEKSAAAGDAESLYNLGVAYDFGWFKPKNLKKARKFYEQAVLRDHAAAMYNLAMLLDSKSHPQECEDLMKKAANLGLPEAIAVCGVEPLSP